MPLYPITTFRTILHEYGPRSNTFTSQQLLFSHIAKWVDTPKQQHLRIIFPNNSHLDDPEFLGKILLYQYKETVKNFTTSLDEATHVFRIEFDILP